VGGSEKNRKCSLLTIEGSRHPNHWTPSRSLDRDLKKRVVNEGGQPPEGVAETGKKLGPEGVEENFSVRGTERPRGAGARKKNRGRLTPSRRQKRRQKKLGDINQNADREKSP